MQRKIQYLAALCLAAASIHIGAAAAESCLGDQYQSADLSIAEVTVDGVVDPDRTSALEGVVLELMAASDAPVSATSPWRSMSLGKP